MTKFSEVPAAGITIRESATDGSDFTNPDADYRRLFLGEDGYLHVKDSAGTVTSPYSDVGDVATDAIWDAAGDLAVGSGADTAARLAKGNAGGYLAMGNGAVIWNAGTSFPGSKATGDRYFRTDLGLECYWDGTRWATVTLYTATLQTYGALQPFSANTANGPAAGLWGAKYQIYMVDWIQAWYVNTTNNGSQYWTLDLWDNLGNTLDTIDTAAGSAATWASTTTALNAALDSGRKSFQLQLTKVSTPGTLFAPGIVTYRLIVT